MSGKSVLSSIIILATTLQVMSYSVKLSPEYITVDVGTDAVTFTCTIKLGLFETTSENTMIIWWKDNDMVLGNSSKYSVNGVSSSENNYTQSLQVNDIEETDHGIYTCTLLFPKYPPDNIKLSTLIIRNLIPQPICSTTSGEPGQQIVCTSSPSDPQITLTWIDNTGGVLTSQSQLTFNETLSLSYTISIESSNQWFTCRATSTRSADTKECVIGYQTSMTSSRAVTSFHPRQKLTSSGISQSKGTHGIPTTISISGQNNNTVIAIWSIIGAVGILVSVVLSCYIFTTSRQNNRNGNVDRDRNRNENEYQVINGDMDVVANSPNHYQLLNMKF
ncbi:uncharacterized protein LOC117120925 [Anneissia japonica]|uniref:uncharacterized protein LOC117120925 n=1 Tax=Anneissia japonica TaxID=1529436 RepID=UPI001425A457|nr:uncharacterized protein LOC117120925 [Anneissia japonica]XP_033121919.1 uncharacterized protein LOC117120925 [Anneissia japonica]